MPNIFKSFLRPAVNNYVFPDAESIQMEEPEVPVETPEEASPAEEDTEQPPRDEEEDPFIFLPVKVKFNGNETGIRCYLAVLNGFGEFIGVTRNQIRFAG